LIDISESAVEASAKILRAIYPELIIHPLVADFTKQLHLPSHFFQTSTSAPAPVSRKLIFFPGSTISNFTPHDAIPFLQRLGRVLSPGDFLFIGVDREKDPAVLERAYDDHTGVTAEFNLNLLHRIAAELDSDIDPRRFKHRAIYNRDLARIEMHLDSLVDQVVRIGERRITFRRGESIHTENSYKYSPERFARLAGAAGYELVQTFSDSDELFSLYLCRIPD
jgi:dimethylhistidine N-methyltransferase